MIPAVAGHETKPSALGSRERRDPGADPMPEGGPL